MSKCLVYCIVDQDEKRVPSELIITVMIDNKELAVDVMKLLWDYKIKHINYYSYVQSNCHSHAHKQGNCTLNSDIRWTRQILIEDGARIGWAMTNLPSSTMVYQNHTHVDERKDRSTSWVLLLLGEGYDTGNKTLVDFLSLYRILQCLLSTVYALFSK